MVRRGRGGQLAGQYGRLAGSKKGNWQGRVVRGGAVGRAVS